MDLPLGVQMARNQAAAGYDDRDDDATATILPLPLEVPLTTAFCGTQDLPHRIAGRVMRVLDMRSHEVASSPNRIKRWLTDPRLSQGLRDAQKGAVGEVNPIFQFGALRDGLIVEGYPGIVATALAFDDNLNGSGSVVQGLPAESGEHIALAQDATNGISVREGYVYRFGASFTECTRNSQLESMPALLQPLPHAAQNVVAHCLQCRL